MKQELYEYDQEVDVYAASEKCWRIIIRGRPEQGPFSAHISLREKNGKWLPEQKYCEENDASKAFDEVFQNTRQTIEEAGDSIIWVNNVCNCQHLAKEQIQEILKKQGTTTEVCVNQPYMEKAKTTEIGQRDIPIKPGKILTRTFSSGAHGEEEAGIYEFWTVADASGPKFTVRCRKEHDPGERIRRMEKAEGYQKIWKYVTTQEAVHLQPATEPEVVVWLEQHPDDAAHVE